MLDVNHQLYQLSESIDWDRLEKDVFCILDSQHASLWRLVCGSVYLKSFFELSSSELLEKWVECPYFRFFCSGSLNDDSKAFPLLESELEALSCKLIGEGYDAMINAMNANPKNEAVYKGVSSTVH